VENLHSSVKLKNIHKKFVFEWHKNSPLKGAAIYFFTSAVSSAFFLQKSWQYHNFFLQESWQRHYESMFACKREDVEGEEGFG